MELNGDILIGATRERVWSALNDANVLLASIPGCEEVMQVSATETHVRVLVKIGPVRARFVGKMLMSEVRPNEGCVLNFEGSGGPAGFAKGKSTVSLASEGDATRLRYTAEASVGGKLGQIGGRMIDASAKQTADQFFQAFSAQLEAPPPVPAPSQPPSAEAMAEPVVVRKPAGPAAPSSATGEGVRVLWFALGCAATAFGFWIARALGH
jgi:carbon monoxide dehydrogenase subunit G